MILSTDMGCIPKQSPNEESGSSLVAFGGGGVSSYGTISEHEQAERLDKLLRVKRGVLTLTLNLNPNPKARETG